MHRFFVARNAPSEERAMSWMASGVPGVKFQIDPTSRRRFDLVDFDSDCHVDIAKMDQCGRTLALA